MPNSSEPERMRSGSGFGPDRITRQVHDAAGQKLQLRVAVGTPQEAADVTHGYNLNGQLATVIDGNGNRAELRYDGHGRQDRWVFPSPTPPGAFNDSTPADALATAGAVNEGDYEEYGYDPNGNRTSKRMRSGNTITYSYDALNRMTLKVVPERPHLTAAQTRDVHYAYDLRGLQTAAKFDSLSGEGVSNAYDGFGRLASSTVSMGGVTRTLSSQYNAAGVRTRLTRPDGSYFNYFYDGLGRMKLIRESDNDPIVSIAYDAQGQRASLTYLGGTSMSYG